MGGERIDKPPPGHRCGTKSPKRHKNERGSAPGPMGNDPFFKWHPVTGVLCWPHLHCETSPPNRLRAGKRPPFPGDAECIGVPPVAKPPAGCGSDRSVGFGRPPDVGAGCWAWAQAGGQAPEGREMGRPFWLRPGGWAPVILMERCIGRWTAGWKDRLQCVVHLCVNAPAHRHPLFEKFSPKKECSSKKRIHFPGESETTWVGWGMDRLQFVLMEDSESFAQKTIQI